ncbi:hypothetical protein V8V91_08620 [Algoriphagus halophilus]|uniref:hypothetical protein n=1 Tax=Algoriphagus halophilus TaxID=226505 RepID=UPI00358DFC62
MTRQFLTKLFYDESDPVIIDFCPHVIPRIGESIFIDHLPQHGSAQVVNIVHRIKANEEKEPIGEMHIYLQPEKVDF